MVKDTSWSGDITLPVLSALLPHPKYFHQDTGVGYVSNEIFSRHIVIVGKPGSGKTTFSRFVALYAHQQYTRLGFTINVVESPSLEALLYDGIEPTDVNILILQDATKATFLPSTLRDVHRIRQVVVDATEKMRGLVLLIFETHVFHSLSKDLRSNFDVVAYLSLPNNPYDLVVAKKYLGHIGLMKLAKLEPKKVMAKYRRYTVAYYYGNRGMFIVEPPEKNVARKLV